MIDRKAVLPAGGFNPVPSLSFAQSLEQAAEPVIIELLRVALPAGQLRQALPVTFDPFFDLIFGVVGLGQDADQPDRQEPAAAQSGMQSVISDLAVVSSPGNDSCSSSC